MIWIDGFSEASCLKSATPELSGSRTVAKMCSMSVRLANWRTKPSPMPWFVPVTSTDTILNQGDERMEC